MKSTGKCFFFLLSKGYSSFSQLLVRATRHPGGEKDHHFLCLICPLLKEKDNDAASGDLVV